MDVAAAVTLQCLEMRAMSSNLVKMIVQKYRRIFAKVILKLRVYRKTHFGVQTVMMIFKIIFKVTGHSI